jgi:raffinose/stachyose/melibiose transport system substrate-binding protein
VNGNIAKYLEPLNGDLSIEENYDLTKTTPWTSRGGTYFALPYVGVVQGVYYNKELFEKYGVTEPQTWGEFMDLLETIKEQDPDIIPIANGLKPTEDSEMFMSLAANYLEGPEGRARLMRTDGTALCYTSPRVVNAFRAVTSLKPYLPENVGTVDSQTSKELFLDQEAAMLFGGSWDLQKVADNADFEWGVFAVPAPAGKQTYVIFQPDIGIGINRDSANKEAAQEFLKWLTTKQAIELTSRILPGFYVLNENKPATASDSNDQKFWDLAQQHPADIRWMFTEISDKYPRADAIIRENLFQIMRSGMTPEQAAQNLQNGLGQWYEPAQTCKK